MKNVGVPDTVARSAERGSTTCAICPAKRRASKTPSKPFQGFAVSISLSNIGAGGTLVIAVPVLLLNRLHSGTATIGWDRMMGPRIFHSAAEVGFAASASSTEPT